MTWGQMIAIGNNYEIVDQHSGGDSVNDVTHNR